MTSYAIVPVDPRRPVTRNAVLGGVLGVDVASFVYYLVAVSSNSAPMVIIFALAGGAMAGMVAGLLALLFSRRRVGSSFEIVEGQLARAVALLERGLIDQDDYRMLKRQIMASTVQSQARIDWPVVVGTFGWAMLMSSMAVLFGFAVGVGGHHIANGLMAAVAGATVGASLSGGTTYAVQQLGSGRPRFRPLGLPDEKPALDAGQPWLDSPANRDVG